MEKVMWLVQGVTVGHTRMLRACKGTVSKAKRRPAEQSWGQPRTTVVRDTGDNPAEQPWSEGDVRSTQWVQRGSEDWGCSP